MRNSTHSGLQLTSTLIPSREWVVAACCTALLQPSTKASSHAHTSFSRIPCAERNDRTCVARPRTAANSHGTCSLSPRAFEKVGFNLTGRGGILDRDKHKHGTGEKASVLMSARDVGP